MFYLLYKTFSNFSVRERVVFVSACLLCVISGIFVGINTYYAATTEVAAAGGTYTEGMIGQPVFINPLIASGNDVDQNLIELVFSSVEDIVAAEPAMGPDKKSWIVILKKNIQWDDGKPITADDVVFTIETIQDPNAHSPLASTWQGVVAEKINDDELRIKLKTPYAFFLDNLYSLKVAPQHIFGSIPAANLRLSEYNLEPIGNGPYQFSEITTEKDGFVNTIVLVPNKNYPGAQPFINELIIRFYRNEQSIISDFNTKAIDGLGGVNPDSVPELKIGHRLLAFSIPRYYALFLNSSAHPALKEKVVRQALALGTDTKKVIKEVFHEYAMPVTGPLPAGIEGYNPAPYNSTTTSPERAKQLFEESGWLVNPEDGVRYKTIDKNRVRLAFDVITPDIPFLTKTMDIIQKDWGRLGIAVTPVVTSVDEINKEALKTRNYQIIIFGNILKNNPDVFSFWHSSQKFYPGLNLSLYDSKTVDATLEKIREESNTEKRLGYLNALQATIAEEAPAIFLFNPTYLYAITENLRGLTTQPITTAAERFKDIERWHIKTKRVFAQDE